MKSVAHNIDAVPNSSPETQQVPPSKPRKKSPPAPTAASAWADEQAEYAVACLEEALPRVQRLLGLVTICHRDREMSDEEFATFEELTAGLSTNVLGALAAFDSAAWARNRAAAPADSPRSFIPSPPPEMARSFLGDPVSLREAVDEEIQNIDGIVGECRANLDRAALLFMRKVGECGGDCTGPRHTDTSEEFIRAIAELRAGLEMVPQYLDPLRAPRPVRRPSRHGEVSRPPAEQ